MDNRIILSPEELELIGQHRYRKAHNQHLGVITLGCYVLAAVAAGLLYKFGPGYTYIFGLAPAVIPMYISLKLTNQATKAGEEFADQNGTR